jgi:metal-responsive CopG/Arc/MetJ family transcriptional regulator
VGKVRVNLRLEPVLLHYVDSTAEALQVTRTEIIKRALRNYVKQHDPALTGTVAS